ncbi:caspase family protein [Sorangium sp. So ce216]
MPAPEDTAAYVREIAADNPRMHWRLDNGIPGAVQGDADGATAFNGGSSLPLSGADPGGPELTAEMWVSAPRGTILSYAAGAQPDAFVLVHDQALEVTVLGESVSTGIALGTSGWRHIGVSWHGETGALTAVLDGRAAWTGTLAAGRELPAGGALIAGWRKAPTGEDPGPGLDGALDEIAWYDHIVPPSRLLSHVLVAQGLREPTPHAQGLPVEFATQLGHTASITSAAFSPDGRLIASVGRDQTVLVWDAATGRKVRSMPGTPADRPDWPSLVWSPDGRWIVVTGGADGVRIGEVLTGRTVRTAPDRWADALAFSPDGRWVALADPARGVLLWDPVRGEIIRSLEGRARRVGSLAVSADGAFILSGSMDFTSGGTELILWDASSGKKVRSFDGGPLQITAVALSPDGRLALSADSSSDEPMVRLWDVATGRQLRAFRGHRLMIIGVAFSPDGRFALSGSYDHTLVLWDVATGEKIRELAHARADQWPHPPILASGLSPDGRIAFSAAGRDLVLRDVASGDEIRALRGLARPVGAVCFDPARERALIGLQDGTVNLWDLASLQPIQSQSSDIREVRSIAVSPDGRRVLAGGNGSAAILWELVVGGDRELAVGGDVRRLPGENTVQAVAFDPGGRWALLGRRSDSVVGMEIPEETLTLWDASTGTLIRVFVEPGQRYLGSAEAIAFGPEGRFALFLDGDGRVRRFDTGTGAMAGSFVTVTEEHENSWGGAFGVGGRRLLTYSDRRNVRLFDTDTGALIRTFRWSADDITAMALSPDGAAALLGTSTGGLFIWDMGTGAQLRALPGHTGRVNQAAWSPEGKRALTASSDGTAKLWDLDSGGSLSMVAAGAEWLIYADDGLFDGSPGGTALVAMIQGTTPYAVDQLAVENNRPDILLERFNLGSPQLRAHFHAHYLRRLKKAGLTEADLSGPGGALPRAPILRNESTRDGWIDLDFDLLDADELALYQIWVNDVPLFEGRGKPVSGTQRRRHESIDLTPGSNRIEISAVDARGRESLRAMAIASITDKAPGDLYFLGFGVSRYEDARLNLGYAHKDVLDLAGVLQRCPGFGRVHVRALTNEEVTVAAMREAKTFLHGMRPNDTLVLFISGHGGHDRDEAATYYFLTHEAAPENLAGTAASFELIEDLLVGIASRKKLFLMDTCESGDGDDPAYAAVLALASAKGLSPRIARNVRPVHPSQPDPLKRHPWLRQRSRFVYLDLTRRSGAIVFSSSRGGELSYESATIENGYFTKEILTALTSAAGDSDGDRRISTDELRAYVTQAVSARSHGLQNPTVDRDDLAQKFGLPVIAAGELATPHR